MCKIDSKYFLRKPFTHYTSSKGNVTQVGMICKEQLIEYHWLLDIIFDYYKLFVNIDYCKLFLSLAAI